MNLEDVKKVSYNGIKHYNSLMSIKFFYIRNLCYLDYVQELGYQEQGLRNIQPIKN